jgi:16S rRNA (adenine1518-N6/adenine1519-N6)-dimethyltransferase
LLIKDFLEAAHPKKRLGQHFLTNPAYVRKIADSALITPETPVLEIGPGAAALTEELTRRTERLTVIEFDRDAAAFIAARFPQIKIVERDVLEVDLSALFSEKAVAVGNLPYNISVKILQHCTRYIDAFSRMVFMFQSEAADRISAEEGSKTYSSLSVFANYYYRIKRVCRIGGGNFFPKTKVDSTVLEFIPREQRLLAPEREESFFSFMRKCFRQKRKTLKNNIGCAAALLTQLGFPENVRAEQLSLADFIKLYEGYSRV